MTNNKELQIPGFLVLNRVYQSTSSLIYRGIRTIDNKYIILKTSFSDHPSLEELAAIQNEYQLLKKLHFPGIIEALDLIKHNQQLILVLNDVEGETLQSYLAGRPLEIEPFLKITLQLTDILANLKENHIVHKDIKPSSIIIQPETLTVELIDFNIADVYTAGETQSNFLNSLEGSLPYMSPEQTGRMNRRLDYRSDLYSLGITMYEMLVGQLPFQANDTLEWVHAHLAKQPPNVSQLNPSVPQQIAHIIAKLLAKLPDERYDSAQSLKMDLLNCQQQWIEHRAIKTFTLNQYNLNDQLQISQKLYGREAQIKELELAFETVIRGTTGLVMVTGPSGIGKSSLIKELHKPVVRQHGYYIESKFDQLHRYIPYNAIVNAFQQLIKQVLTEPDYKLNIIKDNLKTALKNNAQLIIDFIPDLELIIGKQPAVAQLTASEEQRRLIKTFRKFVGAFARAEHPLVLFIDDLQWADSGSLSLLELLLKDIDLHHLLIVGAYRDNEIDAAHPLIMMIDNLEKASVFYKDLRLEKLSINDITELLMDTFKTNKDSMASLANLIMEKTQGNPFFINEFLKNLYRNNYIYFSYANKGWQWDIKTIAALPMTANVVDMLINDIKKMPVSAQEILKLASCIGFSFNLNILAIISKQNVSEVLKQLKLVIEENFIQPEDNSYKNISAVADLLNIEIKSAAKKSFYKFTHDRIYQAVYALIPARQNARMHLEIGRLLLNDQDLLATEDGLLAIVSHFNRGLSLITDKKEKKHIAKLNLEAGKRAKNSNAYDIAIDYFSAGIKLLSEKNWKKNHKLAFSLYLELAECEYLNGHFNEAEAHFDLLLNRTKKILEKAKIYRIMADLYTVRGKYKEAINVSLKALRMFGINLSANPSDFQILKLIIKIRFMLGFGKIQNIEERLQPIVDSKNLIVDNLLNNIMNSAYFFNKKLVALSFFTALTQSLKNGYSKYTSAAFIGCGFVFVTRFNAFDLGLKLIDIGIRYEEKFDNKAAKAYSHMGLGIFLNQWRGHSLQSVEQLKIAYQAGLESGEMVPMIYSRSSIPYMLFYTKPLPTVAQDIEIALPLLKKLDNEAPYDTQLILKNIVQSLCDSTNDTRNDVNIEEAEKIFTQLIASKNNNYICLAATFLSRYYFIMDNIPKATQMIEHAFSLAAYHEGTLNFNQAYIIHALCLAINLPKMPAIQRFMAWRRINKICKKLAKWSKLCAVNFEHGYYLISAEIARLNNKHEDAETFYNKAIDTAVANDYIFYVAIAHERAAKYFLTRQKFRYVRLHIMEAYYNYMRWGANNKCRLLIEQFGEYIKIAEENPLDQTKKIVTTSKTSTLSLDYMALVKSMQVLSSEIQLDLLLKKLIHIVLEDAGAQRCLILLKQGKKWLVEAEGDLNEETINMVNPDALETRNDLPISVIQYAQRTLKPVIIQDVTHDHEFSQDPYLQQKTKSLLALPVLYQGKLRRILYLENNSITNTFTPQNIQSIQLLISQAAISLENAKFYRASNHFVPYAFLKRLNRESLIDVKIGDKVKRKMSVLFCDIRGFTTLSESLPANEIFKLVSEFLGSMEPIISRFNGFIDKYIGDAVMALFDNADDAIQAAIAMHNFQKRYKNQNNSGHQAIEMGIGINTGELILGVVGNAQRMDCSVIGDSVNIAARVESLTRAYQVPILITEGTRTSLKNSNNYQLRLISNVTIKGKAKPIDVWAVEVDNADLKDQIPPSFNASIKTASK